MTASGDRANLGSASRRPPGLPPPPTLATRAASRRPPGLPPKPTLAVERSLAGEGFALLAAVDEVGRGALCGPVSVGVALLALPTRRRPPRGLADSKLLSPAARSSLVPPIQAWVAAHAVGHASSAEIDTVGLMAALRLAGHRALAQLPEPPDCILLDGNYDYLSAPTAGAGLFDSLVDWPEPAQRGAPVRTVVKADLRCASVAAASVLAKTTRDALMEELAQEHPGYGWEHNRGYATPDHTAALARRGPTPYHRMSWRLPLASSDEATLGS